MSFCIVYSTSWRATKQHLCQSLYGSKVTKPRIPRKEFVKLMMIATSKVEFSFNNLMYRQIDGVAMGSPLGPILATIFVGYHEKSLLDKVSKPIVYFRYVDDIFACFSSEDECEEFAHQLNAMHQSLQFTCEKEVDQRISFLDVCVHKESKFVTSVYRKKTFTGQYVKWQSFCPRKRKTKLVATLVHRAMKVCSTSKLNDEIDYIKRMLCDNGYPEEIVQRIIMTTLKNDLKRRVNEDEDQPTVVLRLPYIGNLMSRFEKKITTSVSNCYANVKLRLIPRTTRLFNASNKDAIPITSRSNVVYRYTCHCGSGYIGKTKRRLDIRIGEHEPASIVNEKDEDSSIAEHLVNNPECLENYSRRRFSVMAYARNDYHLKMLEAIYITCYRPNLCAQKNFVFTLQLYRG